MKFAKSVMDRLVFTDVDYLNKDLSEGYRRESIKQTGKDYDPGRERSYESDKLKVERAEKRSDPGYKRKLFDTPKKEDKETLDYVKPDVDKEVKLRQDLQTKKSYSLDFSKSILENMGLEKAKTKITGIKKEPNEEWTEQSKGSSRGQSPSSTHVYYPSGDVKRYTYDKKKGEVAIESTSNKNKIRKIPANAAHEKELKNASLHATLDAILEKGRPGKNKPASGGRKVVESDDALVVPDSRHVQTMSNPGPTEAEHYERTSEGSKRNLAKLAESKSPMDRKAAEAGMKRHED